MFLLNEFNLLIKSNIIFILARPECAMQPLLTAVQVMNIEWVPQTEQIKNWKLIGSKLKPVITSLHW